MANFLSQHTAKPGTPNRRGWLRWLGVGLVALSFVLYGGLLVLPFLPWGTELKILLAPTLVILGEVAFWLGALILGKAVVARYRRYFDPRQWSWYSKRRGVASQATNDHDS
jgi:hypothetical protein